MLGHERERLLYRILSGKTILKNLRLVVIAPSLDLLYESEEIYCDYYEKSGVLSREELRERLIELNNIDQSDINFLKDYNKLIEGFQKELFLNFETPNADPIRSYLKQARNQYEKIITNLSKYETYCKEGLANYAKSIFLIRHTTFKDKEKFIFDTTNPISVLSELQQLNISNTDIREISKNSSWGNIWYGTKDSNVFNGIPTLEQQLLLMWSKMYDNIRESPDSPSEEVVMDNDALDGWLCIQREEKKKEKVANRKNSKVNSKINNSDEVFFIAHNKEELDRIQKMNSGHAQRIQQERMQQIYEKKSIDHHNLIDVRRNVQEQFHKLQLEHIKGGKKN